MPIRLFVSALFLMGGLAVSGCSTSAGTIPGPEARAQGAQGQERVTICHRGRTMRVPRPAVQAHLNHGDTLGACTRRGRRGR